MISHVMPKLLGLFFARTCLEQDTSRKETLSFAECPRGSTRNFDAWESEFYRIPMESSPECKACVFGKKLIFKSMMVSLIKTLFKGSRSLFNLNFKKRRLFFSFISFFGCVTSRFCPVTVINNHSFRSMSTSSTILRTKNHYTIKSIFCICGK